MYMNAQDIILENDNMRLTIGSDCIVKSLICKATSQECLNADEAISLFSVTQERPFNNEVKLSHPNKRTTFEANRLRMEDGRLFVRFEVVPVEAVIEVREAPAYISFQLAKFIVHPRDYNDLKMATPPVAELRLLQLPVRNREHFGEWLNVMWDEKAAVNVLATSPHARIDSERRRDCRILTADALRGIRLVGTGAALIVCAPEQLLDAIDTLERDYDLPRGVESRRGEMIDASYYWCADVTPENVDEHIRYAKMGGFRQMLLYYTSIFISRGGYRLCGDYDYRPEYPNGREDLQKMLKKIKAAGITPGIHFLHTHIGIESRYVTPIADHRLNKVRRFTLSRALDEGDAELYVEENPEDSVLVADCRILQFGGELIAYEGYTTEPPYRFTGCTRGFYKTRVEKHPLGQIGGLVDVCEYGATSLYPDQASSLPEEIANKLADAYNAGFEFVYFDGSEGTNAPYEYHVPNAQYRVYKKLNPTPLYTEGAAKGHFSWHFLSGGNAFDTFPPEVFKEKIREFPLEEAPRMRNDFTRINFGWWGFWTPGTPNGSVAGTQADLYEFGESRAAAFDCPIGVVGTASGFANHPRTRDIMEVLRRWEDVRAKHWLTPEQKLLLRDPHKEHILLINEAGEYELVPYEYIDGAAGGDVHLRAFLFERGDARYVVYWHVCGAGKLALPVGEKDICVMNELGETPLELERKNDSVILPVEGRRYMKSTLSRDDLLRALRAAKMETR